MTETWMTIKNLWILFLKIVYIKTETSYIFICKGI